MVYLTTKPQPAKTKLENSPEMKKLLTEIKSYNSLVDGPLAKILDSTSKSWPPPKGKLMTSDVLWFINLSDAFKLKPTDGVYTLITKAQDWQTDLKKLLSVGEYSKGEPAAVLKKLQKSLANLYALSMEVYEADLDSNTYRYPIGRTNSYKGPSAIS